MPTALRILAEPFQCVLNIDIFMWYIFERKPTGLCFLMSVDERKKKSVSSHVTEVRTQYVINSKSVYQEDNA
jgi:hypothetical protein